MILRYGKKLSETQAGATIKDCVITIPSFFTYTQRKMMLDAAEIAGLSVLQLVHENTAAATMYGIDRTDSEKDHIVIFFNMGGKDTEVSLVKYSTIIDPSNNKTYEHVEILAEASDPYLGGENLDMILLNMMAERFNDLKERKGQKDVRESQRTVKRMLKEAIKVKDILSANKQMQVKLGELMDYVSLITTIERKDLEEAATSFFDRVQYPIQSVLKKAGIEVD